MDTPVDQPMESTPEKPPIDYGDLAKKIMQSPAFIPAVVVLVGFLVAYWRFFSQLPTLWLGEDGYYSHGFLVPFIVGYILYRRWPTIKDTPVMPVAWIAILLVPLFWLSYGATLAGMKGILSYTILATILVGIVFVAGWGWLKKTVLPTLYLAFAFPIWTGAINSYTNPLQLTCTKISFHMLDILGLHPFRDESTTIYLGQFVLDVGVPCSGLKLMLAILAFTCFFMLIGGLKWWGNLAMVALIIPLCLFINSLRIALIGIVGNEYGQKAGATFHDYSGYITLVLCFFILFKFARLLGWKD